MPAQSKSQQRFFGVVKAMQKGDIPKKGKAGKIAKTMSKDDVDDFASTKHKGKPEKVKREQRVKNLIKKMVREELAEMNEAIGKGMSWKDLKVGTSIEFTGGTAYVVTKIDKNKLKMNLKRRGKVGGSLFAGGNIGLDKKSFESQVKVGLIKYLVNTNPRIKEGKLTESQQVAKTILQQLGGNRFIAMTGAKNFGSSKNSLQFKIGRNSKSISHVIITLKSSDLYDVEFIRMRGTSRKVVKKVTGVYADMLGKIFTKYTGMNVRL